MHWYVNAWKQYAVFSGRASRQAYWMFFLFNVIIGIAVGFVFGFIGGLTGVLAIGHLAQLYALAALIPGIAVGVRRMHDTDHSGWWIICPIVNLVFACMAGTHGENRFGPDPKAAIEPVRLPG